MAKKEGGAPASSLWKNVVSGGTAGVCELLIMYPTDVMKTRAQLSSTSTSMASTFKSILESQGVRGFYRGIISPIMAEAPKRAWKFTANENLKAQFGKRHPGTKLSLAEFSASGALAGMSEALINCPFETVKVRMQSKEFVSKFKGTSECLMYLLKHEGVTSVYKGLEAQMWRNVFWNSFYFGSIGYMNIMREGTIRTKAEKLKDKFIAGCVGSTLGTLANTPFDVVKSRMQNQSTELGELKYRHTFQGITVVHAEEGFAALYKGLGARLLRLGPGGGIMVVVFDYVSETLNKYFP